MAPNQSSRKGKSISKKACDLCRSRKLQCTFDVENVSTCKRCVQSGVECTFLITRKPRGPVNRHVAEAKARMAQNNTIDSDSPSPSSSILSGGLSFPIGSLTIEYLCPLSTFEVIIADYLEYVYPLVPLVHRPTFQSSFQSQRYHSDPGFFRLCVSLSAITVASMPGKFVSYGCPQQSDVVSMVDRASQLVALSKIITEQNDQADVSSGNMICSLILSLALHYTGKAHQGWAYASDAILTMRSLGLYKREAYKNLNIIEAEMCKRAFWMVYIILVHDRLSFAVPHVGMSYDATYTDWEFLVPLEVDDDDLIGWEFGCQLNKTPLIAGFVALIKIFLCVVDLISNGFPGKSNPGYIIAPGSLDTLLSPTLSDPEIQAHMVDTSSLSLDAVIQVMRKLHVTLENMPEELKLPHSTSERIQISPQFDIMRANIHITSLYIQSVILETFSATISKISHGLPSPSTEEEQSKESEKSWQMRQELWKFRESIARELLNVLASCSRNTLEANGTSMVVKIREVAATLLDRSDGLVVLTDVEERSKAYIERFIEILAELDHVKQLLS